MRLSDYILANMEVILARWESFAATLLPAASHMDSRTLRDHAQPILEAIAADLKTSQTRGAQMKKSMGHAPVHDSAPHTAAQTHAILRARSGFDMQQLAAEYRALRASVLRLWMDDCALDEPQLDDVMRFNEAVDQALAESIAFFSAQVDRARNLFLGMLGHDMRSPLQTIQTTAKYLAQLNAGLEVSDAATLLISSGSSMKGLLDDLVDFNRTSLGLGMNVSLAKTDLNAICNEKLREIRAAHPGRHIDLQCAGDAIGVWDGPRLQRMIGNLVENGIKHGAAQSPVRVGIECRDDEIEMTVRNGGEPIPPEMLTSIFNPLTRAVRPGARPEDAGLGLGLFIASEIAKAHGGAIDARSDADQVVFAVRLPRISKASQAA